MLALIAESSRLYARLALSTSAWNREREARLMSMDALAAAISHEVGQPLSAVTSNGDGRLCTGSTRRPPDPEMAAKSLRATIDAGQRTADVIKSIRAMFAKRPGTATEFNLNDLVRETASLLDRELTGEQVSLQLALDDALPPILADRVQMQQVLAQPLHQRDRIPGRDAEAGRAASRSARRRSTARSVARSQRQRRRHRARKNDTSLRRLLHDQGDRHRPRPVALPHHRRRAWRAALGHARRARGATFHLQLPRAISNRSDDPIVRL